MHEEQSLPPAWQDWTITERIGRGSFGTVYKAERPVSAVGADQIAAAGMTVPKGIGWLPENIKIPGLLQCLSPNEDETFENQRLAIENKLWQ
ncbi:MAG: hypothetical protein LUG93_18275 [Lachnospiraceae bacterium]|nr:hypothetical protein [Lachnospiraceae bacterium]